MKLQPTDLLERERERDMLGRALDGASAGAGRLVTIGGEAGIGKSSLLAVCGAMAARRRLAVLRARGAELEREIPFGVALQLLERPVASLPGPAREEVLRGAAGLARPLLEAGPATVEPSLLHGLYWLAANLAELRPLALLLDDVHWADDSSITWLNYLAHRIQDLPVVAVVAFRAHEPGADRPLLDRLVAQPGAWRLAPAALSPASVERLVRERHPDAQPAFCEACARVTAGNPFLVRELLETVEAGDLAAADELGDLAPDAVTRSVLERLQRAGPDAEALARAVAVLGDGARLGHAAALARLDGGRDAEVADELAAAQILRSNGGVSFCHPLLRSAVYAAIPPATRAALHARAARMLNEAGARPDRVAAHLLHSPPGGDAWVVETLRASAERAHAGGAPATAVSWLRRALREPPAAARRPGVLLALARAEAVAGDPRAADHFTEALAATHTAAERARLTLELARTLSAHGRGGEAAAALDRVLEELGGAEPELALAVQATWIAISRTNLAMRERVRERVEAIAASPSGDPSHEERMILAQLASEQVFAGAPRDEAVRLARAAYGEGRLLELETSDGSSWVVALSALGWADDLDAFEQGFLAGLADARRRGSVLAFATCSYGLNFSHFHRGRLADAVADAQQALAAQAHGWREYIVACRAQLAWALVERGELSEAADALAPLEADATWHAHPAYALVPEARGRIALARGDHAAALALALEAGRRIEGAQMQNPSVLSWASLAAIAASRSDPDRARELADRELAAARRFGAPRAIATALRAAGVVRGGDDGVDLLRAAVAELEGSPAALERTRATIELGAALRAAGHPREAREPLRTALDQAHRMGAAALERRAREELIAAGARPRRPVLTGIDALTPSERRVAGMAAEGMNNREIAEALFVTRKAVQWHLGRVYRKLGIAQRSELPPPSDLR